MKATEQSENIGELAAALAGVQAIMRGAVKDAANPHLRSKYADLASVNAAAQPELGKAGIAVMQTAEDGDDGTVYLATTLAHSSGGWIRGRMRVDVQPQKGINLAQALGSALTYARRYSLAAMLGIVTEDDDGASAGPRDQQQLQQAPQQQQAPEPTDEANEVGLQFNGQLSDEWKKALRGAGFAWNAEKHSYRAPVTDVAVNFAQACLRDSPDAVKWSRIPEAA